MEEQGVKMIPVYVLHPVNLPSVLYADTKGKAPQLYKDILTYCKVEENITGKYYTKVFEPYCGNRIRDNVKLDEACVFMMDTRECQPILLPLTELVRIKYDLHTGWVDTVQSRRKGVKIIGLDVEPKGSEYVHNNFTIVDGVGRTKQIAFQDSKWNSKWRRDKYPIRFNVTSIVADPFYMTGGAIARNRTLTCCKKAKNGQRFYDYHTLFEWELAKDKVRLFWNTYPIWIAGIEENRDRFGVIEYSIGEFMDCIGKIVQANSTSYRDLIQKAMLPSILAQIEKMGLESERQYLLRVAWTYM